MKIVISGHGGHMCEAHLVGTGIWDVGENVAEAIGRLIFYHSKECDIDIEITPSQTTAYERSGINVKST